MSVRRARLALAVRGLAARRGVAALLVLVAALTTGTAAAAATYRQAAADSALRARLAAASPADAGVTVSVYASPRAKLDIALPPRVPALPYAATRTVSVSITGTLLGARGTPIDGQLLWRQGDCARLAFPAGRCPRGPGEVAVPAAAAGTNGWRVGGPLQVTNLNNHPNGFDTGADGNEIWVPKSDAAPIVTAVRLRIAGLFTVRNADDRYWMGAAPGAAVTLPDGTIVQPASAVVDRRAFWALPHALTAHATVDQPVAPDRLTTGDLPTLRVGLDRVATAATEYITVSSGLADLLAADAADRQVLGTVVRIAAAQLLGLVGLVLVVVLASAVALRRAELAAEALRGRHPLRTAGALTAEPALLLVVGLAGGLALAPVAVQLAARLWLRPGTPVHLVGAAVGGAAAVAAVGLLAAFVVTLRAARRPAAEQLGDAVRRAERRVGWWEVAAFTLAAAGLVELLTAGGVRDRSTPWALLAPALCGLGAGLLLARLVPVVLRPSVRATEGTPHLSVFLLLRELRRDVAAWRVGAAVAVAVALLSFAVAVAVGADADRRDRAGLVVGAPVVATVSSPSSRPLPDLVRAADRTGAWAMAATELTPYGSDAARTIAVDAPRLPAVAGWTRRIGGLDAAGLARALRPTPPATYAVPPAGLRIPVRVTELPDGLPLRLAARVAVPGGGRLLLPGDPLRPGSRTYSWAAPATCRTGGCRLVGLRVAPPAGTRGYAFDLVVELPGPWTSSNGVDGRVPSGWRWAAAVAGARAVDLARLETPYPLPAATAGDVQRTATGLDGEQLAVTTAVPAAALPRLLAAGTLLDYSYARLHSTGADPGSTVRLEEVWLGRAAPADALDRLRRAGLEVDGISRQSDEVRTLGYLAPAAGLDGYLAVAVLAATVAFALLAASVAVAARRRRGEYVALAIAGVPRRAMTRALVAAAAVRLALAAATGLASGLGVAYLAAPGVPLASPGSVPAPHLGVPALPAVLATLVTVVPLILVEVVGVRWAARRSGLRVLREAVA